MKEVEKKLGLKSIWSDQKTALAGGDESTRSSFRKGKQGEESHADDSAFKAKNCQKTRSLDRVKGFWNMLGGVLTPRVEGKTQGESQATTHAYRSRLDSLGH